MKKGGYPYDVSLHNALNIGTIFLSVDGLSFSGRIMYTDSKHGFMVDMDFTSPSDTSSHLL